MNETKESRQSASREKFEHLKDQAVELAGGGSPSSILLALSKEGDEWRLAYGELVLGMEAPGDIDWNWSDFRLIHKTIGQEDALELVDRLVSGGSLAISKSESIDASGELKDGIRRRSASNRHRANWPVRIYGYLLDNNCRGTLSHDDLFEHGLPYYPDVSVAIAHRAIWLSEHYQFPQGSLQILIIDRRARFSKVKVNAKNIMMEVDWGHLSPAKATVKSFVKPSKEEARNADIRQENGTYSLRVGGLPYSFHVALVTDAGDKVDWRSFLSYSDWGQEGVEIDIATEELKLLLLRGEDESLEFKANTHKEQRDDVLESVVAFANRRGGIIIIGVDDQGKILDSQEEPKVVKSRLQNWIADCVDPRVDFEARFVEESGVHIIYIKELENKPSFLRNRGPYIRAGSTDRIMTRAELDEVQRKR